LKSSTASNNPNHVLKTEVHLYSGTTTAVSGIKKPFYHKKLSLSKIT